MVKRTNSATVPTGDAYDVAVRYLAGRPHTVARPLEAIAKLYKLTPMELRVLFAIVQVGGVPEVAAMMGSSGSTIRTHLRRLFSKTGTDRQADLVKLVAAYVNPLLVSCLPLSSALSGSPSRKATVSIADLSEPALQE